MKSTTGTRVYRSQMRAKGNHHKLNILASGTLALSILFAGSAHTASAPGSGATLTDMPCEKPGWFPSEFGLKDHHLFWYDGYYYLVAIDVFSQNRFAYGRSTDFCTWEDLSPIMQNRPANGWDDFNIWAPFVYEEDGTYYMFYTGVTRDFTQSIMLATSINPADPKSWTLQGMIFQPDHESIFWQAGEWADCRDPTVFKTGNLYYLYCTAAGEGGGVIGLATATSIQGPWTDRGAIIPAAPGAIESSSLAQYDSAYYLFYTLNERAYYRIGPGPTGPWQEPHELQPGWAHEVWQTPSGEWFISYLTDYTVTISPLAWDTFFHPPRPVIGHTPHHLMLPIILG